MLKGVFLSDMVWEVSIVEVERDVREKKLNKVEKSREIQPV